MDKNILFESDPSGKFSRKEYMMRYYTELYNDIIKYSIDHNLEDIPFKEQIYCYKFEITPPKCKNPNCNNQTRFKNSTIGYRDYCSNKCISSDPRVQELKKQRSLEKYGTNSPTESDIVKRKISETNLKKYNAKSPLQNEEIKKKSQQTLLKHYDVDNPTKSKEIQEKRISHFNVEQWRENFKNSMNELYGVENALQNEEIKNKYKQTLIDKYGEKENINLNIKKWKNDLKNYLLKDNKSVKLLRIELLDYIKENYKEDIIINNKNIIPPYELDIYLPKLNLVFDFNGLFDNNELNKPNNYFELKSNLCDEKGIQLVQIYEDDWVCKKDIVKSMILNKLGLSIEKIYARKTVVKEVDTPLTRIFLNNSHVQGYVNSQIRLGLFYNDELVSLMTLGKPRKNMNSTTENEDEYELLRFCNKINTNVVGGASKLFKYFVDVYKPKLVTTYADRSYSKGNLYRQLGFEFVHMTKPNYYYVVDNIRKYRFGFRKDILIKQGFDPNKTEHEIMLGRNIYRIYNSGNYKFIYEKNKQNEKS